MGLGPSGQEALTQQREVTGTHYLSTLHYQDIWEQAVCSWRAGYQGSRDCLTVTGT